MVKELAFVNEKSCDEQIPFTLEDFLDSHDVVSIRGTSSSSVVFVSYMDYSVRSAI